MAECGARKPDGDTCHLPAGYRTSHPGAGHCVWHYGMTPSGKRYGAKEAGRQMAELRYGDEVDIRPEEALAQEVRRSAGLVAWLTNHIRNIAEDPESNLDTDILDTHRREREHLAKTAKLALDAGVEARQVALLERQADMVADAIRQVLDNLDLTPEQRETARTLVPQSLRMIALADGSYGQPDDDEPV